MHHSCRAAYLEEGLLREEARGRAVEQQWSEMRDSVNTLIINGELDVVKLKRDLIGMK